MAVTFDELEALASQVQSPAREAKSAPSFDELEALAKKDEPYPGYYRDLQDRDAVRQKNPDVLPSADVHQPMPMGESGGFDYGKNFARGEPPSDTLLPRGGLDYAPELQRGPMTKEKREALAKEHRAVDITNQMYAAGRRAFPFTGEEVKNIFTKHIPAYLAQMGQAGDAELGSFRSPEETMALHEGAVVAKEASEQAKAQEVAKMDLPAPQGKAGHVAGATAGAGFTLLKAIPLSWLPGGEFTAFELMGAMEGDTPGKGLLTAAGFKAGGAVGKEIGGSLVSEAEASRPIVQKLTEALSSGATMAAVAKAEGADEQEQGAQGIAGFLMHMVMGGIAPERAQAAIDNPSRKNLEAVGLKGTKADTRQRASEVANAKLDEIASNAPTPAPEAANAPGANRGVSEVGGEPAKSATGQETASSEASTGKGGALLDPDMYSDALRIARESPRGTISASTLELSYGWDGADAQAAIDQMLSDGMLSATTSKDVYRVRPQEGVTPEVAPEPAPVKRPAREPVGMTNPSADPIGDFRRYVEDNNLQEPDTKTKGQRWDDWKRATNNDPKYQRLKKAADAAIAKRGRSEKAEYRAEQVARVKAGDVDRESIAYAPLHTLPDPIRQEIQRRAAELRDQHTDPKVKNALQRIVDDAGRDKGAEVEKQKDRIVADLTGEAPASGRSGQAGQLEREAREAHNAENGAPDPLVEAFVGSDRQARIRESIASIDRGEPDTLAQSLGWRFAAPADNPLWNPMDDVRGLLEHTLGERVEYTEPEPAPTVQTSPSKQPTSPSADLFGNRITESNTGKQKTLEFGRDTEGEQPTQQGWITAEGKLRQGADTPSEEAARQQAAEARLAAENAENQQGMLTEAVGLQKGTGKRGLTQTATGEPVSAESIIKDMERATESPIRPGLRRHEKGVYDAAYNRRTGVIRTREANDLDSAAHETGHRIHDNTLKMRTDTAPPAARAEMDALGRAIYTNPAKPPARGYEAEGFADYLARRMWGENPQSFAPETDKWFRPIENANAKLARDIAGLTEKLTAYDRQGAVNRVIASVSKTGKPEPSGTRMDRARRFFAKIARALWEPKASMMQMENQAGRIRPLAEGESPVKAAKQLFRIVRSQSAEALRSGVHDFVTGEKLGNGIIGVLRDLKLKGKRDWQEWNAYNVARIAVERWKQKRNPGVSEADAKTTVAALEKRPGWKDAADKITAYHNSLVRMLQRVGRFDQNTADQILDSVNNYSPLLRVMEDLAPERSGLTGGTSPIKRMKGSGRTLVDPMAATALLTERIHRAAADIVLRQKIVDLANTRVGMGKWVEKWDAPIDTTKTGLGEVAEAVRKIQAPNAQLQAEIDAVAKSMKDLGVDLNNNNVNAVLSLFRQGKTYSGSQPYEPVFRNGKVEWYWIHPDILRELRGSKLAQGAHAILDSGLGSVLTYPTRMLRAGAVGLYPRFGVLFNPSRDIVTAMIRTEGNSAAVPFRVMGSIFTRLLKGTAELTGKGEGDPWTQLYKASGGEAGQLIGGDIANAYKIGKQMMREASGTQWRQWLNPLRLLQAPGAFMEGNPRILEMRRYLESKGYTTADLEAGKPIPLDVKIEAMARAANVTTDFGTAGEIVGVINRVKAFANAPVQDIAADLRMFRDHPIRTVVRGTAILTIPTLTLWWLNKDKDWYEELPAWQKWTGFNFEVGGRHVWLPSPFMLGMLFSRLPEAIMDSAYRSDPTAVKGWGAKFFNDLTPNDPVPLDAIKPIVEVIADYDFFRQRSVVPRSVSEKAPEDQYTAYTTELSRYFGARIGYSPVKIDHLMRGYAPVGTDLARLFVEGDPSGLIGTNRILPDDNAGQSIQDFYDKAAEVRQRYEQAKSRGDVDKDLEAEYRKYNHAVDEMAKVRRVGRARGKEESKDLQRNETALAREALGREPLASYPPPERNVFVEDLARQHLSNDPKEAAKERAEARKTLASPPYKWSSKKSSAENRKAQEQDRISRDAARMILRGGPD